MELTGNCKFCGQEIAVMASAEQDADLVASQECNCPGAVTDRRIKRGLEKVEMLFGDECEDSGIKRVSDEQIKILNDAVNKIGYDEMLSATYCFGNGIKGSISKNTKHQIVVSRTNTKTYKLTTEED